MSNPTDNFSFDLDPYDRLAQMLDGGLFGLLPLPPSWSKYVGAQYAPDPSLFSAPASDTPGFDKSPMFAGVGTTTPGFRPLPMAQIGDTPGFHKSPAVLEALAAADPRPAGFYRSPALLGASAMMPGFDPNLPPTIGPQAMLFGRPGLPPDPSPLPAGPTPPPRLDLTPVSFPLPLSPPASVNSPTPQSSPVIPVGSPPDDAPQPNIPPATDQQQPVTNGRGIAPPVEPPSNSLELEQEFQKWPGRVVRLPDGSPVRNPYSPNGLLMSPFSDLSDVAAAGRRLRSELARLLGIEPIAAAIHTYDVLRGYLGHGGLFDYQRRAYPFGKDGFTQLRQFRDVANFNVGLVGQQAGLSLWTTLEIAGRYAARNSSNYKPDQTHGLDPQTQELIEQGYRIGESGAYEPGSHR